ncbi:translation initiation factor IF-2 isoform X2 [Megalobrama amblycephala]|uniref:translation initiation factor IF-2 isoform X2 n=1 Tax=Megalobrama amblycephala TaxID=75352 RepID=UPI00201436D7|nr:translation initiation factor IF-2 isoform X2 [Megalobrama amblycephala]
MMSYLWIFVLGSLIVTGVKMQEDGVEGAENAESPGDDLPSAVPDEDNTASEDLPPDSKDESLSDAEPGDAEPTPEKPVEEVVDEAAAPAETEAEQTDSESDVVEDEQPTPPAAAEEPVEEDAPAETDEGDADKTEADPPAVETEQENTPEEATGEVTEEPAQEEPDEGEADTGETDAGEADAGEADTGETDVGETDVGETDVGETDVGETDVGETDVGETDADEAEPSVVPEDPVDVDVAVKVNADVFDLSDALNGDTEIEMGDADKHSSGQGKARSAEAASEPKDSGSGTVVGVVCGIAVAAVGAITGYFTYQKKKLCFKVQRGDPESAKEENGTQSEPQVLSTLLNSP